MFSLLPLLVALAATTTGISAVPLEGRNVSEAVQGCRSNSAKIYVAHRNGTRHGHSSQAASVSSSVIPVQNAIASKSAVVSSTAKPSSSSTSKPASSTSKPASSSAAAATSKAVVSSSSSKAAASSSSTTTSSAAATASSTGDKDADLYLKLHNDFRAQYGAGKLTWSSDLAAHAKTVSSTCKFQHLITSGEGQNLAAGVGGGYSITSAFNSWANEASQYDYNNPGFSEGAGHFTQVVWKATTQVGCALVECPAGSIFDKSYNSANIFVTCNYKAAGNVVGNNGQYFKDNVGQKV